MTPHRQSGMALAIVLWFIAGMCLLVSGITHLARADTRMAQLHRDRAIAVAAGDGAILLMLAGYANRENRQRDSGEPLRGEFSVGPESVTVVLVPAAGLVNVNYAPAPILAVLFTGAGGLPVAEAESLAQNVVLWRENTGLDESSDARGGRFQSPEDLLQVAGMSRSLWDAVRDYVTVDGKSSVSRSELAAQLEAGTAPRNGSMSSTAADGATGGDRGADTGAFRVDAFVSTGGRTWLRRKWAVLGAGSDGELPWFFSRVEAPRVMPVEHSG